MKRINIQPRNNWQQTVENLGFGFHTTDVPYWDETAAYIFTLAEINNIEKATAELWEMCLAAVQHVIDNGLYSLLKIPDQFIPYIERTWESDDPSVYGRFDLAYNNGEIKLLEFNADTPTSLYEAGIVQWFWLQDFDNNKDQFNAIHEKLIASWKYISKFLKPGPLYFSCLKESLEDLTNTEYLRDCAIQAGLQTNLIFMDEIGWSDQQQQFVDLENNPIKNIFKLYPWEWLVKEAFAEHLPTVAQSTFWIEPAWKMILSNKGILPILWHLFPNHPLLLKASFTNDGMGNYVKKPLLSREGANIDIFENGEPLQISAGSYGNEGFIFQSYFPLPATDGNYAVIGSWVIGQEAAGIGIRESNTLITDNFSRFVPHYIDG